MADITQAINPRNRTEQIGMPITRGGVVVLDAKFTQEGSTVPEFSKLVGVGGAGDVIIETADGVALFFASHDAGDWIPVVGAKVLTTHIFPSPLGEQFTTATGLFWYGGI